MWKFFVNYRDIIIVRLSCLLYCIEHRNSRKPVSISIQFVFLPVHNLITSLSFPLSFVSEYFQMMLYLFSLTFEECMMLSLLKGLCSWLRGPRLGQHTDIFRRNSVHKLPSLLSGIFMCMVPISKLKKLQQAHDILLNAISCCALPTTLSIKGSFQINLRE